MAKKKTQSKKTTKKTSRSRSGGGSGRSGGNGKTPDTAGKHLVIVESPAKARTINKYLGRDYVVMASVGHVRDLPSKPPKGVKRAEMPVPGVDLDQDFQPTYELISGKGKTVTELKRAAKKAADVWLATDLDREGEAIAWHLVEALGLDIEEARRVVFNAITRDEIRRAFERPRHIDMDKVNAQQARRILDRIVGYQVSPLLWKKVAGGLSAGRVQSVAVRLIVEREREIRAFVPDEYWKISGYFALSTAEAQRLRPLWTQFQNQRDTKGNPPTKREGNAWLSQANVIQATLIEYDRKKFEPQIQVDEILGPLRDLSQESIKKRLEKAAAEFATPEAHDLSPHVAEVAAKCGLRNIQTQVQENENGRGPARWHRTVTGVTDTSIPWVVRSIETKQTTSRPPAPFITSTLQQAAANQLGFPASRTMQIAQQLYEGVNIHGSEGQTGLITYMRTDSTNLSPEAIGMARSYIDQEWGDKYLPNKPNYYATKNQQAQEAHEAIRPTDASITPKRVQGALSEEQHKLYRLVWERFTASQMVPALWDATTVLIGSEQSSAVFKATGRTLVFEGFYKATGIPSGADEAILPALEEDQPLAALQVDPEQKFTNPPPRYTEASLVKKLESEGIGRPSTYAAIIQVIQDRNYAEKLQNRFHATDLGEVVTDKLIEAFPGIMDVGYTREMEDELDAVEEQHHDWIEMLRKFYGPFREKLEQAHEDLEHAKAEVQESDYHCAECGAPAVYRFGKNGKFLSCSRYPECKWASPIDHEGKPASPEYTDILCPDCGDHPMQLRKGRYGPFLSCSNYPECKGVVNLDNKGRVKHPTPSPLTTELECPKCGSPLYLRTGKRGLWLSCSTFPKCRGRLGFNTLDDQTQERLKKQWAEHEKTEHVPTLKKTDGSTVPEEYEPQPVREDAPADGAAD